MRKLIITAMAAVALTGCLSSEDAQLQACQEALTTAQQVIDAAADFMVATSDGDVYAQQQAISAVDSIDSTTFHRKTSECHEAS